MKLETIDDGEVTIIFLREGLRSMDAGEFAQKVDELVEQGKINLLVDLGAGPVGELGVQALYIAAGQAADKGGNLKLLASERVKRVMQALTPFFELHEDRQQAVSSFSKGRLINAHTDKHLTPAPLRPPVNVSATKTKDGIVITWERGSSDETAFVIEVRYTGLTRFIPAGPAAGGATRVILPAANVDAVRIRAIGVGAVSPILRDHRCCIDSVSHNPHELVLELRTGTSAAAEVVAAQLFALQPTRGRTLARR